MKKQMIPLYLILATLLSASEASCHAFNDQHIASLPVPVKVEKKEKTQEEKTFWEKMSGLEEPDFKIATLPTQEAVARAYQLFNTTLPVPTERILDSQACKNLELLCGQNKKETNLLQLLNRTHFAESEIFLGTVLTHPITDTKLLNERQAMIRAFVENADLRGQLATLFTGIQQEHAATMSLYSEEHKTVKLFIDGEYWQLKSLKSLNTNVPYQHTAITVRSILLPVLQAAPLTGTNYYYGKIFYDFPEARTNPALLGTYAVLNAYFGFITYLLYDGTKKIMSTLNLLHEKTIGVARIISTLDTLERKLAAHAAFDNLQHRKTISDFAKTKRSLSVKMRKLLPLLRTKTFKGKPTIFALQGRVKAAYALVEEIKAELLPALIALAEVDAYLSCATVFAEHQNKPNHFCFAMYEQHDKPSIVLEGMWNPFVGSDNSVINSIKLGSDASCNMILTGPNAGGKSTFSKGLTLSIIMAQTIGMVPAQKMTFTLFHKINTYMNISDDTAGGNSLFKSEVLRVEELLKTIKELKPTEFAFSVMDEMFSGTSPKEGEAASCAVAKNIGAYTNSIAVIATHFPKMKKLEEMTSYFKNYQVRVVRHADGTFSYPFKLEEGAADQNVAIDILQKQGFESSILADANEFLNE